MAKGCIKEKKTSWTEFNLLLETVDLDDKIGHFFFVDIEFDYKDAFPKQIMHNEVYPPIAEKKKN